MSDVYSELRDEVLTGALPPGTPLGENVIAKRFGISRTPVRAALQRLVIDQLATRSARGVVVRNTSPEEILDIYEIRINLEGLSSRAAADRRSQLDLAKLQSALDAMRNTTGEDANQLARSNRAFHEQVWASSHNPTLVEVLTRLNVHLVRYPTTTLTYPGRWKEALDENSRILEAIRAREADDAEQWAVRHMSRARDIRLAMYAEGPDTSVDRQQMP